MIKFNCRPETNLKKEELEYHCGINLHIVANHPSQTMRDYAWFNIRHFEQKMKNYKHDQKLRQEIRGAVKNRIQPALEMFREEMKCHSI